MKINNCLFYKLLAILYFLPCISTYAQIRGVVSDSASGLPLSGVSVLLKGKSSGTQTDSLGKFSFANTDASETLQFSFSGYSSKDLTVSRGQELMILLQITDDVLSDVVVIGYGTQRRRDLTGSISSVKGADLVKTTAIGLDQALQGRAAGVTVSANTGSPGAPSTVRVRGVGTVGDADPLYVVDGVPMPNIVNLNMNDVENIEVLKDASATAIYGSRGANGVILIKTKGGKKGKTVVSYDGYVGIQNRWRELDVLNGPQWGTLINEKSINDGLTPRPELANPDTLPTYNWGDLPYQTGFMQNHKLAISGGSDKMTYYISYDYLSQEGIVQRTDYLRHSLRINNTYKINKIIEIGHNLAFSAGHRTNGQENGGNPWLRAAFAGYVTDPITPIYKPDGSLNSTTYSSAINPLGLIEYGTERRKFNSLIGNVNLNLNLAKGLEFRSIFGLTVDQLEFDNFIPEFFVAPTYQRDINIYQATRNKNTGKVWTNTLNYVKEIGRKHNLNLLLGHEIQENDNYFINASRGNIPGSVLQPTLGAGDVSTATNNGNLGENKLVSIFSRVNYNYDNRYLITANFRRDGSSRFGPANRFGSFPSVGLGWNVHNESFFKSSFINQLKIRGGWGQIGNQNIPNNAYFNIISLSPSYVLGSPENVSVGAAPYASGNPNLKWEKSVTTNVGLDLTLFNHSFTFSADYFVKNTDGMILALPILNTSGYQDNIVTNAGKIQNKGLEITTNYTRKLGAIQFNIGGNISFISNKVINLGIEGNFIESGQALGYNIISRTEVGYPIAQFYGFVMDGIFQTQEEVTAGPVLINNTITKPGDVRYRDIGGPDGKPDGVINNFDRTFIGNPLPKFIYGINLGATYKKFDLSAFFQGSYGNKIFSALSYSLEGGGDLVNMTTNILDRWNGPGTSNSIPRLTTTNSASNVALSSRFVRDGSYFRLKNMQVGYTFSVGSAEKRLIKSARVYLGAQNLFTITSYTFGMDPEIGVGRDPVQGFGNVSDPLDIGIDRGVYPQARSFLLGFNVNF